MKNQKITKRDIELYNSIPKWVEDNKDFLAEMDRIEKSTASYQLKQLRNSFNQLIEAIKKAIL